MRGRRAEVSTLAEVATAAPGRASLVHLQRNFHALRQPLTGHRCPYRRDADAPRRAHWHLGRRAEAAACDRLGALAARSAQNALKSPRLWFTRLTPVRGVCLHGCRQPAESLPFRSRGAGEPILAGSQTGLGANRTPVCGVARSFSREPVSSPRRRQKEGAISSGFPALLWRVRAVTPGCWLLATRRQGAQWCIGGRQGRRCPGCWQSGHARCSQSLRWVLPGQRRASACTTHVITRASRTPSARPRGHAHTRTASS